MKAVCPYDATKVCAIIWITGLVSCGTEAFYGHWLLGGIVFAINSFVLGFMAGNSHMYRLTRHETTEAKK